MTAQQATRARRALSVIEALPAPLVLSIPGPRLALQHAHPNDCASTSPMQIGNLICMSGTVIWYKQAALPGGMNRFEYPDVNTND